MKPKSISRPTRTRSGRMLSKPMRRSRRPFRLFPRSSIPKSGTAVCSTSTNGRNTTRRSPSPTTLSKNSSISSTPIAGTSMSGLCGTTTKSTRTSWVTSSKSTSTRNKWAPTNGLKPIGQEKHKLNTPGLTLSGHTVIFEFSACSPKGQTPFLTKLIPEIVQVLPEDAELEARLAARLDLQVQQDPLLGTVQQTATFTARLGGRSGESERGSGSPGSNQEGQVRNMLRDRELRSTMKIGLVWGSKPNLAKPLGVVCRLHSGNACPPARTEESTRAVVAPRDIRSSRQPDTSFFQGNSPCSSCVAYPSAWCC